MVCVWGGEYTECICLCVCVHVETEGQCEVFLSVTLYCLRQSLFLKLMFTNSAKMLTQKTTRIRLSLPHQDWTTGTHHRISSSLWTTGTHHHISSSLWTTGTHHRICSSLWTTGSQSQLQNILSHFLISLCFLT